MDRKKRRQRNRLSDYDYSENGYYFVTICTKYMDERLGRVKNEKMVLNNFGEIVQDCWHNLANHYQNCVLDEFIIMPNHVHGIILIDNSVGEGLKPSPTKKHKRYSLSEMIRGFKTFSSRKINDQNPKIRFQWQRSFYDHIIRNERTLREIRQYIRNNPAKWRLDRNHPDNQHLI